MGGVGLGFGDGDAGAGEFLADGDADEFGAISVEALNGYVEDGQDGGWKPNGNQPAFAFFDGAAFHIYGVYTRYVNRGQ